MPLEAGAVAEVVEVVVVAEVAEELLLPQVVILKIQRPQMQPQLPFQPQKRSHPPRTTPPIPRPPARAQRDQHQQQGQRLRPEVAVPELGSSSQELCGGHNWTERRLRKRRRRNSRTRRRRMRA